MSAVHPARNCFFGVILWDNQSSVGNTRDDQVSAQVAGALFQFAANMIYGGFTHIEKLGTGLEFETWDQRNFYKARKNDSIEMKRGVTTRTDLWDWHEQVINGTGPVVRKSGIILLFDRGRPPPPNQVSGPSGIAELDAWLRVPLAGWYIHRALPEALKLDPLMAAEEKALIETVTLKHEGITRISLSMIPGAADVGAAAGGLVNLIASGAPAGLSALVGGGA